MPVRRQDGHAASCVAESCSVRKHLPEIKKKLISEDYYRRRTLDMNCDEIRTNMKDITIRP